MMRPTYSTLRWDALAHTQRLRVLLAAKLPTSLAIARWSQLTASEQSALCRLDWFFILDDDQSRKSGTDWTTNSNSP